MNKPRRRPLVLLVCGLLLLQGCAIPGITTREPAVTLPSAYGAATTGEQSAAAIRWNDFFVDPNLATLIDTALTGNQEVNILLQRLQRAANEVEARRGEYLPFVGAGAAADLDKVGEFTRSGAVERQLEIREEEAFPEPLGNLGVGLTASWELDVWHKLRNATQVASLEYLATAEGRHLVITALVAEVAHDYYELMALDNQLQNLDRNIEIQTNALQITRDLLTFGRTTSLAVARFEAEVNKNQSERFAIAQQIVAAENHLNLLLGRTPQPVQRSSDTLMTLQPPVVQAGVPSQLLANRPDIRRAELELAAAKLDIAVAKANFYPSFAIRAGVGFEAFKPEYLLETPASLAYTAGVDMVAPLVNRRAIAAQYKNASAAQVEAAYEYEQTLVRAFSEVSTKVAEIDNLARNYALKTDQVAALNTSVDVAGQLFTAARADYLEVLLAQREALEARSELIETRQRQMSAMVDLYRALGGGWQPASN